MELQEVITQLILPAYQQLVLEAPSVMERVAGEMLIQALWADCLRQLNRRVIGSAMRAPRDDRPCIPRRSRSTDDYRPVVAPSRSSGVRGVRRPFQKGPYTSLQFLRTIL